LVAPQRLVSVAEWVLAVERAYVAAATGHARTGGDVRNLARARAAAAAVASRYLAVGTPRSFGIVGGSDEDVELALEAHRTWFAPRDIRRDAHALAADIVCVYDATPIRTGDLRRGTHVNLVGTGTVDPELVATITDEPHGLPALAAGLVDGRQLDEITIFTGGDVAIALAAI
jgi:ornithine cyclodeaminase/alanine dehydrogenase-like protein (mu-crystallin family)